MKIIKQVARKTVLTKFDQIPLVQLLGPGGSARFIDRFSFQDVQIGGGNNSALIEYQRGIYNDGQSDFGIHKVAIEERKMTFEVFGLGADVDLLSSQIRDELAFIANNSDDSFLIPLSATYNSVIVSQLDFDYELLVNNPLLNLISSFVQDNGNYELTSEAKIKPIATMFEVSYTPADLQVLADYRIALSRNQFMIEQREGTAPSERMYRTDVPLSPELHIELLQKINDLFKDS